MLFPDEKLAECFLEKLTDGLKMSPIQQTNNKSIFTLKHVSKLMS